MQVNDAILTQVQAEIQTALLKRGFTTKIELSTRIDRQGELKFVIKSEPFQTTPVIFKQLQVSEFGSWLKEHKEHAGYFVITIDVYLGWESFSGGTNGTELFRYRTEFKPDAPHERIFETTID